jgi:hypothetical protein
MPPITPAPDLGTHLQWRGLKPDGTFQGDAFYMLTSGLQWYGAIAGALAALIVSLDLGRRWTGVGFLIFVSSSIALIGWGFLKPDAKGIGTQNLVLFVINVIGVYRYLIRKCPPHRAEGSKRAKSPRNCDPRAALHQFQGDSR